MMDSLSHVPRILIVEDDIALQASLAMPLFEAGYLTATTRHKEEALAILIEDHYDAVIIDPFAGSGMLELLEMLRNDDMLGTPRVVVVTREWAKARDAWAQGWADAVFDKGDLDWPTLLESMRDLIGTP